MSLLLFILNVKDYWVAGICSTMDRSLRRSVQEHGIGQRAPYIFRLPVCSTPFGVVK